MSELAKALVAAQAEMPKVEKKGRNPHFKNAYVTLDDLLEAVVPVLNRHGLALVQMPATSADGTPALWTRIEHVSGEFIQSVMPLVLQRNDMQGVGAAITYARRYMLAAALGIAESLDDDGSNASAVKPADRRVDPETPIPKTYAEVEALWLANNLGKEWLEQAVKVKRSVQTLATVTVRLLATEPASEFGYSKEQIQAVFAEQLDGLQLPGPEPVSDEQMAELRAKAGLPPEEQGGA